MKNQNLNMDLSAAVTIKCESCGNPIFVEGFYLKRISAIASPSGQEMIMPIQIFSCAACGYVNDEFNVSKKEENATKAEPSKLIV